MKTFFAGFNVGQGLGRLGRLGRLVRVGVLAVGFMGWGVLAPLAPLGTLGTLGTLVATAQAESLSDDIHALQRQSKARAAIVKQVSASVVHIAVEKKVSQAPMDPMQDELMRRFFPNMPGSPGPREFTQKGLGTGVIANEKGYVITNNHVVEGASKITVKLKDGREFQAKLVGTDSHTDVAVVQIKGANLPVARLGNSDELEVGESVLAIGNPFGLEQTITSGIVSAKGRSGMGITDYEDFIQTDASINPGNSGGPLINLMGEVVGINTAIFSRSGGSVGIGFAIPINMAQMVMRNLVASGKMVRGFLGVFIQDVTPDLAEGMELPVKEGVLISNVTAGGPADKGGLKRGDVLVELQGKPVKDSNMMRYQVATLPPGTQVDLTLLREGQKKNLRVTLGEMPGEKVSATPAKPKAEAPSKMLGMHLKELGQADAEEAEVDAKSGLLVTDVEEGSPAGEGGVTPGMVLLESKGHPLKTLADLQAVVTKTGAGKKLLLLVTNKEGNHYITITLP